MVIRCPQCEHTRSISESKIPPRAEVASCPRCGCRFRFRSVRPRGEPEKSGFPQGTDRPFPASAPRTDIDARLSGSAVTSVEGRADFGVDARRTDDSAGASLRDEACRTLSGGERPERDVQRFAPPVDAAPDARGLPLPQEGGVTSASGIVPVPALGAEERETGRAPVFIYAGDGPPPEERVDQDMGLLRDDRSSIPVRDLGRLKEFPDNEEDEDFLSFAGEEEEARSVPWENPAECGWVGGFMATLRGVMFGGPSFFASFSNRGSLAPGYLFFILMGYICVFGSLAWSMAAEALLPGVLPLPVGRMALPVLILLAPIALGLMQLFVVGCIRLVMRLFAPERADFVLIYKVVSYAPASFVLCVVPFVGPPIAAVWFMVSLVGGCRGALRLSWPLSLCASLPPAFLLLGSIAWYFL